MATEAVIAPRRVTVISSLHLQDSFCYTRVVGNYLFILMIVLHIHYSWEVWARLPGVMLTEGNEGADGNGSLIVP